MAQRDRTDSSATQKGIQRQRSCKELQQSKLAHDRQSRAIRGELGGLSADKSFIISHC